MSEVIITGKQVEEFFLVTAKHNLYEHIFEDYSLNLTQDETVMLNKLVDLERFNLENPDNIQTPTENQIKLSERVEKHYIDWNNKFEKQLRLNPAIAKEIAKVLNPALDDNADVLQVIKNIRTYLPSVRQKIKESYI